MLEGRTEKNPIIVLEDVFSPVSVMYVEINNRHPFQAVFLQRMGSADRNIVVETKPHGTIAFSMMTRRSHTAECGFHFAAYYKIDRRDNGAGRPPGGRQRPWTDDRVWINAGATVFGGHRLQGIKMRAGVCAQELAFLHLGRVEISEYVEQPRGNHLVFDRRDSAGIFRVALASIMLKTFAVTDVRNGQRCFPLL